MRSVEELMESKEVVTYIDDVKRGYFNLDEEIEFRLESNWLESEDMHGDGEYVVNSGDYMIMDGLTERESESLLDSLLGTLEALR